MNVSNCFEDVLFIGSSFAIFHITLGSIQLGSKISFWIIWNEIFFYPTPLNLGYFYCIGSLLGLILVIQLITGVLIACYYIPFISIAFTSVDYVIRDLAMIGFLVSFLHAGISSFFLSFTFIHVIRAICYCSFQTPKHKVLISG
jgi:quinol-cytochrome oxidoreductase complex cytochrome b subunit